MIVGVGVDFVEVARFARAGERLKKRIFTEAERRFAESRPAPALHFAARYAAKEAVLKAMGTGWTGGISWTDVEIVRLEMGNVAILLKGRARAAARRLKVARWHVSLTHTRAHAAAVAIAER